MVWLSSTLLLALNSDLLDLHTWKNTSDVVYQEKILGALTTTRYILTLHYILCDHSIMMNKRTNREVFWKGLVSALCFSPSCLWEHANCADTRWVYFICFSPSATCPLQVCLGSFLEPCVWICGSHAIWCQQAPSATLIHSQNSPRSVGEGPEGRPSFTQAPFKIWDRLVEKSTDRLGLQPKTLLELCEHLSHTVRRQFYL